MKKIKLVQIITRMDRGGSSDIVRIFFERLDPRVYDMILICGPTLNPSDKTKAFFNKYKGKIYFEKYLRREIDIFADIFSLITIFKRLRKEKPDIVHTHTAKAGFIGRIAARLAGVPFVAHTPHGNNFYGYFNAVWTRVIILLEKIACKFSDKVIVLTNIEKEDLLRYTICKSECIGIMHSGIEINDFEESEKEPYKTREKFGVGKDSYLVGMVSRLERVKGCGYFIEAAKIIGEQLSNVKFIIAGEGSLKNELEEHAKTLGLSNDIIFTGWSENSREILAMIDVLVVPSLNEAVGRTILEAGLFLKPVVATNVGGIPEIISDGRTGILVPPADAARIADSVVELLRDSDKRAVIGRNAQDWVKRNFSVETMVKEIHSQYMSFIKS